MKPTRASLIIRAVCWSLAGLVVLLVCLLGVTATLLPGCTFCHQEPPFVEQTAKSAHPDVDCVRCHVQPGPAQRFAYAYHLVLGMGLGLSPVNSGPIAGIPDNTCLSCHEPVMKQVVTADGVRIKHSECSKGRLCTDCHSQTAHGVTVQWPRTPQMNQCLDCHSTSQVRSDCTMCHEGRSQERRIQTGEWAVTHGRNWEKTHGMGTLSTCASCHPDDYCARCHGIPLPHEDNFIRTHPVAAATNAQSCKTCHSETFCTDCHGVEMPHPVAFTPAHSTLVRERGDAVCYRCHIKDDCTTCHVKHVHPGGATTPPGGAAR